MRKGGCTHVSSRFPFYRDLVGGGNQRGETGPLHPRPQETSKRAPEWEWGECARSKPGPVEAPHPPESPEEWCHDGWGNVKLPSLISPLFLPRRRHRAPDDRASLPRSARPQGREEGGNDSRPGGMVKHVWMTNLESTIRLHGAFGVFYCQKKRGVLITIGPPRVSRFSSAMSRLYAASLSYAARSSDFSLALSQKNPLAMVSLAMENLQPPINQAPVRRSRVEKGGRSSCVNGSKESSGVRSAAFPRESLQYLISI